MRTRKPTELSSPVAEVDREFRRSARSITLAQPVTTEVKPDHGGAVAAPPQQRVPKISVFSSFDEVRHIWSRFEREADATAFQTYDWLKNWHQFIGVKSDLSLCITLVEFPEGVPLMLLPLAVERRGFFLRLVWLGGRVSDYRAPLLAKDFSQLVDERQFLDIWRQVRQRLPRHDLMLLENQPEFVGSQRNPFFYLTHSPHVTNAYLTGLGPTLDAFLHSKRNGRWFRDERRKERRLREQGTLAYHVASNPADVTRILPEMMAQKSRSYRELGVPDLFAEPGCLEFFHYISQHFLRDGFVHLSAVTLDDRILATHWGLVHRGRFYCLLPTYARSELTRNSPGSLLLRRLFEWCIDHGVQVFDFTIGDEGYKDEWCDQELRMVDCIEATSVRGWLYAPPLRLARAAKRRILRSPVLRPRARSLRLWLTRRMQR